MSHVEDNGGKGPARPPEQSAGTAPRYSELTPGKEYNYADAEVDIRGTKVVLFTQDVTLIAIDPRDGGTMIVEGYDWDDEVMYWACERSDLRHPTISVT